MANKKRKSSLEHMTSAEGVEYRIYDDGNHIIGHIFTVEYKRVYEKCVAWLRVSGSPITNDWRTAYNALKMCVEKCIM